MRGDGARSSEGPTHGALAIRRAQFGEREKPSDEWASSKKARCSKTRQNGTFRQRPTEKAGREAGRDRAPLRAVARVKFQKMYEREADLGALPTGAVVH